MKSEGKKGASEADRYQGRNQGRNGQGRGREGNIGGRQGIERENSGGIEREGRK